MFSGTQQNKCIIDLFDKIIIWLLGVFVNKIESSDNDNLLLVQFIFRHGDRSPIRLYHNDKYKLYMILKWDLVN